MDWIYGIHTVNEIIKYSSENITDFCILDGSKNPRLIELCNQAQKRGIKIRYLNNRDLSELVDGPHQGVAILCKPKPYLKENELLDLVKHHGEKAFILVLDGVTDPHNLGACLRSSLAAGVNAVVIPSTFRWTYSCSEKNCLRCRRVNSYCHGAKPAKNSSQHERCWNLDYWRLSRCKNIAL